MWKQGWYFVEVQNRRRVAFTLTRDEGDGVCMVRLWSTGDVVSAVIKPENFIANGMEALTYSFPDMERQGVLVKGKKK